jgi:hypothetical protein
MQTVNRGWLRRRIEAGEMEARCDYWHTDDYLRDAENDNGKTGWLTPRVHTPGAPHYVEGYITFWPSEFSGYGRAWRESCGTITLYFGSRCYSLRRKIA